jgi:hypothetical protein
MIDEFLHRFLSIESGMIKEIFIVYSIRRLLSLVESSAMSIR